MATLTEQVRQGAEQAWTSLAEGWRDLRHRASGALTRFRRELQLPLPVDAERATASYRDGVLRIAVPRLAAGRGRRIPVHGAG